MVMQVIFPAVLPYIVTVMRRVLAMDWTFLVIAGIVPFTTGIGP